MLWHFISFWLVDSVAGWTVIISIKMISLHLIVPILHSKCSPKNLFKFKCSNSTWQWKKTKDENSKAEMVSTQENFQNCTPLIGQFFNQWVNSIWKLSKVISNLPELKSNLDALKKFGVGLLEKGKKEIQNKNKQLRKEFEKNRKRFSMMSNIT